jgi:DNA-binding NarL/FixJ family response regulator
MSIRILVADDHPIVLDGLVAILGTQPDFEIVGTASNGLEVVANVDQLRPDVLLLDLEMPEMDGVEALKTMRAKGIPVRMIVFTAFDTDERILGAVQAGAEGYLLKGAPPRRTLRGDSRRLRGRVALEADCHVQAAPSHQPA